MGFQRESLTIPSSMFGKICSTVGWCRHEVPDATLELVIEIARKGREGRRIGTLFTLGSADAVLASSRALILDPLAGHTPAATHMTDQNLLILREDEVLGVAEGVREPELARV